MNSELATPEANQKPISGVSVWRNADFIYFVAVRTLTALSFEIVTVAVGWWVYDISRDPFDLGLIGLTQLLPALALFVVTGAVADRFPRGTIAGLGLVAAMACTIGLFVLSANKDQQLLLVFSMMLLLGISRAFLNTVEFAMLPHLVPRIQLSQAVSISASVTKTGVVVGPMMGGLLYGIAAPAPFAVAAIFFLGGAICAFLISRARFPPASSSSRALLGGLGYIWRQKILLGAMSLDMIAVLLGGAMALLPLFARDILQAGPLTLGLLRSAYAVGAVLTAAYLGWQPIRDHAGRWMLGAVTAFGLSAVVFGLSTSIWLSTVALFCMGAVDMISVTIRQIIIQLWTPDDMRGRVAAASSVFVGVSNEAGEFRAGTAAALIGPVPAVVLGGIGAIASALLWARWFPALHDVRCLDR